MRYSNTFTLNLFIISIILIGLLGFSVGVNARTVEPHFTHSFESSLYPSQSPLSKQYLQVLNNGYAELLNYGDTKDVNQLKLAVKNRDQAWDKAQTILEGIMAGQINSKNLPMYATPKMKSLIALHEDVFTRLFKAIRSMGDKAKLSYQASSGMTSDYMVMGKAIGDELVSINVIDIIGHIPYAKIQEGLPVTYISVTLSAHYPYQHWMLAGLYVKTSVSKHMS